MSASSNTPSRRVLVTGGASGLGAALAKAYADRGARVVTGDLVDGDLVLDVRSADDWAGAVDWVEEHWGGLDLLVNNAGVAGGGRVDVAEIDEWQWMFEINVFGVARGTRAFVPMMKRQGSGQIINIASLAGLVHPAGMGSYNAAKAAVVAFTETTGHELAAHGISAHVVCPSYFQTNLLAGAQGRDSAVRDIIGALVENSPWTADDIATAVLEGVDAGVELILPDPASRDAYALKTGDRAAYDAVMRKQASKLASVVEPGSSPVVEPSSRQARRAETPDAKETH